MMNSSNKSLKLALIQMCSSDNLEDNLKKAETYIRQAAEQGAQLVVLPEYFPLFSSSSSEKIAIAEILGEGPIQTQMAQWAKDYSIWIIAGSMPIASDVEHKPYAGSLVFNSDGKLTGHYFKIHLFDVEVKDNHKHYRESDYTLPGVSPSIVETPWGKLGLSVCYDLRFPELYQYYASREVTLIACPAAFTRPTGEAHWSVLLRARAIENQCFVMAAAQSGRHANGHETYGHSLVVDPWGQIVGELPEQQGMLVVDINLDDCRSVREQMPVLKHRVLKAD